MATNRPTTTATPLADAYARLCALGVCSDKGTTHSYIEVYEWLFKPWRKMRARVLEIGVQEGFSLQLWRAYFVDASIWGIDLNPIRVRVPGAGIIEGDATAAGILNKLSPGWDIIIDDASHEPAAQVAAFELLHPLLTKGGLYVIEDLQSPDAVDYVRANVEADFELIDRREVKGRYDDVLMVYRRG